MKSFAQHRYGRCAARSDQRGRRTLKGRPIGQNRKAGSTPALIGARDGSRVEVWADKALGWARLLYFLRSGPVPKWPTSWKAHRKKSRKGGAVCTCSRNSAQGILTLAAANLFPFIGNNIIKNAHGSAPRNSQRFEIRNCRWFLARGDQGVERFFFFRRAHGQETWPPTQRPPSSSLPFRR